MDHRDLAAMTDKWYKRIDENRKVAIVELPCGDDCEWCGGGGCEEEVEIPIKYEVCQTCDGKGRHVNPSIDSHGISAEEFYEDPDFGEDYFSGVYDVPCCECGGLRVVPEIDEENASPELIDRYYDHVNSLHRYAAEEAYIRRMGY